MTKDKKEGQSQGNDNLPIIVIAGLVGCVIFQKILPTVIEIWALHSYFIKYVFLMSVAVALLAGVIKLWNIYVEYVSEKEITSEDDTAVFLGKGKDKGDKVYLKQEFRTMHTQVIGTTNAGKSESTVIPMAIQDIKNRSGVLLIDGKPDGRFVDKLYGYIRKYKREEDFKLFSLGNIPASCSFNPLRGDNAQQVVERVFSSFTFENEYFRDVQYKYLLGIVRLIFEQNEVPTFRLVRELLGDMEALKLWIEASRDETLKREMNVFAGLSLKEREERVSGLEAKMSNFTSSDVGVLFEETDNRIDLDEALEKNQIIYFQLPTMLYSNLGEATGKLVLQCFQSAIAKRQLKLTGGTGDESDILLVHP